MKKKAATTMNKVRVWRRGRRERVFLGVQNAGSFWVEALVIP